MNLLNLVAYRALLQRAQVRGPEPLGPLDGQEVSTAAALIVTRNFVQVARLVQKRALEVPKATIKRYWHHCLLALYGYLCFKPV